ncbi:MAG: FtsH protease activity modulator HflK [Oscillospiraceae bacterium]|jgi:membrane protease subunit HflK
MTIKSVKRFFFALNVAVVVLLLILLGSNSYFLVQEQEQAVVITMGNAKIVSTPGIHFKIPFVQRVVPVSMAVKGLNIGYTDDNTSITSESMMITSDYNFVNVDFFVEYKVSNPERYLFASDNPEGIFRNMALSYIRDTIGLHGVDEVITTGKNEIQAEIREKLTERMEKEDIGLQLINITIQDSEPPTDIVKDAFKNVETAKQGKETRINEAKKYESEQLPAARAQVDATLKEAETKRQVRINEAKAQVAVFNSMYEEYAKNPLMTRRRMFYETMEDVLPGLKVVIDSSSGSTSKILPLEPFLN